MRTNSKQALQLGWRLPASFTMAIGLLALGTGVASASSIEIDTLLTNASFESGADLTCPTFWTCGGSAVTHTIGSSEYTAGSDGLSGSLIVPDGTKAALSPNAISGTGSLLQSTSSVWLPSTTYTFSFWVGIPLVNQSGGHSAAVPDTITAYYLANGVQSVLPAFTITPPATLGMWTPESVSFTTAASGAAYLGQNVGVELFEACSSPCNNKVVNFDIGTAVPEPATMSMVSFALLGLGLLGRKRRA